MNNPTDPIVQWAAEGRWPKDDFEPRIARILARKVSPPSHCGTSTTPSDQRPREEKSAPYIDPQYELLLQAQHVYMDVSELGIADSSKTLVQDLRHSDQTPPQNTIFDDDVFIKVNDDSI
ncbi:hypothetical protein QQS21_012941 [Conoideocrella luteorostrata]|uniref:Uncharacterized protein n=1 Tax=Conoideocrella luteorostrata TaxID=1105319 RepID=A0AAJ0CCL1_9HYPO|nr:hypothetical protein QQS21_012941 [Conoideocrella luteorostrata]